MAGLIVTRKPGEELVIELAGTQVVVQVLDIGQGRARLRVVADRAVAILRREVLERDLAAAEGPAPLRVARPDARPA